jgi:putative membrane protein
MMGPYFGEGMGFGWFGILSGWIFMIVFWALVVWAILAFIQWVTRQQRGSEPRKNKALEILEERYAKGEISKEELEEKRKYLQG